MGIHTRNQRRRSYPIFKRDVVSYAFQIRQCGICPNYFSHLDKRVFAPA